MSKKYWIDDDGYIANEEGDVFATATGQIAEKHIEPLTRILESHEELLQVCKCAEADLFGLVSDYLDVDIETSEEPQAKTIRELRTIIAKATIK